MSRTRGANASSGTFEPCPEGVTGAVVVDVSDTFEVEQTYQGKTKPVLKRAVCWQVSKRMEDGRRFIVTERYTDSLSEKCKPSLRDLCVSLLGRALTQDELDNGVELEDLVGRQCLLQVVHNETLRDGKVVTYANAKAVMPLPEGMPPMEPEDYVRWLNREPDKRPKFFEKMVHYQNAPDPNEPPPLTDAEAAAWEPAGPDSDIPF